MNSNRVGRTRLVIAALALTLGLTRLSLAAPDADLSAAREAARQSATTMYDAFARADFETFARYTYPKLIEKLGGKPQMIATLQKGMADMAKAGFIVKAAEIGAPSQIVTAGDELHALLSMTLVLKTPSGEMRSPSTLLGISGDHGATWTFLDTTPLDAEKIREIVPNYNPALKLPAKQ